MSAIARLAARLTHVERQIRTLSLPSLGYSSVDDGAVQFYDTTSGGAAEPGATEGQLAAVVGTQFDGAITVTSVTGPVPPTPTPPTVESVLGGLKVRWDGEFTDALFAPTDWSRLEIHATDEAELVGSVAFDTLRGTVESPRGSDFTVRLPYATHWVWLVGRSQSGKASPASAAVTGTPLNQLDIYEAPGSDVPTGSVGTDGSGNFTTLSVSGVDNDGNGAPDGGMVVYGREFREWFDDLPHGVVAYDNFEADRGPYNTETGYAELGCRVEPGRQFRLSLRATVDNTVTGGGVTLRVRYTMSSGPTTEAPVPTLASTQLLATSSASAGAGFDFGMADFTLFELGLTEARNVRFLVTGAPQAAGSSMWFRSYGDGTGRLDNPAPIGGTVLSVEDVGRAVQQAGAYNLGDGATAPAPPTRRTTTYTATASRTYMGNGAAAGDGTLIQGVAPADGSNRRAVAIFPDMTGDLNGATVEKIEVYLYADLWPYGPGTARVATHTYTTLPATNPTLTYRLASARWPQPSGRWITLPTTLHAAFQSGAIRGIGVGPAPDSNPGYWGRFVATGGNAPKIRVTYVK